MRVQDVEFEATVRITMHDDEWCSPDVTCEILGERVRLDEVPVLLRNAIYLEGVCNIDNEAWEEQE